MDYRALISNMGSSSTTRKTVDITIPEGYTIDQLFDLLDKRGVASVSSAWENQENSLNRNLYSMRPSRSSVSTTSLNSVSSWMVISTDTDL